MTVTLAGISRDAPDLTAFVGNWHVRRRIFDAVTGEVAGFEGIAAITANRFVESGMAWIQDASFPAQRAYKLENAAGSVALYRGDGSHFVTLAPVWSQKVEHLCGEDLYRGRFLFAGPDRWAEIWAVRGPRKRYRSISQFRRG